MSVERDRHRTRLALSRRRLLQGAGAVVLAQLAPAAFAQDLPVIPALTALLAGRSPRWERLRLDLPTFADNGQAVPLRLTMSGPFVPGPTVQAIHLFSERNPVPDMAVFEYPTPPLRVEIDTRIRLAGSQRVVAVAVMSDGTLFGASTAVEVTIAACFDAS